MSNEEETFQLIELNGFNPQAIDITTKNSSYQSLNSKENSEILIAFSIGSLFTLFDVKENRKLHVKFHENELALIKFFCKDKYLFTIDKSYNPLLSIWETNSLQLLFTFSLPFTAVSSFNQSNSKLRKFDSSKFMRDTVTNNLNSNNNNNNENNNYDESKTSAISNVYLEFFKESLFAIVISSCDSSNKQYFYLFEINKGNISFLMNTTLSLNSECIGLKCLAEYSDESGNNFTSKFVTLEDKAIQYWSLEHNNVTLNTKTHVKQYLIKNSLQVCNNLKLIFVLTKSDGKSIVLDFKGNFLVSINCSNNLNNFNLNELFTYSKVFNEFIFLGTNLGNTYIYNLNNFKLINKIDYNQKIKRKFLLNDNKNYETKESDVNSFLSNLDSLTSDRIFKLLNEENKKVSSSLTASINEVGPAISNLFVESNFMLTVFSDNSLLLTNLNKNLLKKSSDITDFKLNEMYFSYGHFNCILDIIWLKDDRNTFLTIAEDQSLNIWKTSNNINAKWANSYFDLLKMFDSKLNNSANFINKNFKYYFTALTLHPKFSNTLVTGDNKGNVYIFDTEFTYNNFKKIKIRSSALIKAFSFSKEGNFLAISFIDGLALLTDFFNDCKILVKLNEAFENCLNEDFNFVYIIKNKAKLENFKINNDNLKNYNVHYENEQNLKLVILQNSYSLQVKYISTQSGNFLINTYQDISYKCKIKYALVHPSEDYVVTLLETNVVNINLIDTGALCGQIRLDCNAYKFEIDISGLYITIVTDSSFKFENLDLNLNYQKEINPSSLLNKQFSAQNTYVCINQREGEFSSNKPDFEDSRYRKQTNKIRSKEDKLNKLNVNKSSSLMIFEFGTGNFFQQINNIFEISIIKYSNDAKYLTIAGKDGTISVWKTPKEMFLNINTVLDHIKKDNKFWDSFRINFNCNNNFNDFNNDNKNNNNDLLNEEKNKNNVYSDLISKSLSIHNNFNEFDNLNNKININSKQNATIIADKSTKQISNIKLYNNSNKDNIVYNSNNNGNKLPGKEINNFNENIDNKFTRKKEYKNTEVQTSKLNTETDYRNNNIIIKGKEFIDESDKYLINQPNSKSNNYEQMISNNKDNLLKYEYDNENTLNLQSKKNIPSENTIFKKVPEIIFSQQKLLLEGQEDEYQENQMEDQFVINKSNYEHENYTNSKLNSKQLEEEEATKNRFNKFVLDNNEKDNIDKFLKKESEIDLNKIENQTKTDKLINDNGIEKEDVYNKNILFSNNNNNFDNLIIPEQEIQYRKDYFINRNKFSRNSNQRILPDPSDIDDLIKSTTLLNKSESSFYDNIVNERIKIIPGNNNSNNNVNLNSYMNCNKNNTLTTDNIEFVYDKIQNFDAFLN